MNRDELKRLTAELLAGELAQEEFLARHDCGNRSAAETTPAATFILHRQRRCGFPEATARGKPAAMIAAILDRLLLSGVRAFATRLAPDKGEDEQHFVRRNPTARYNELAQTFRVDPLEAEPVEPRGLVAIITAGTSDLPVAEELAELSNGWAFPP